VLKEHSDTDLLPAVRAASRAEPYVTPEVLAGLHHKLGPDARPELVDNSLRHGLLGI
jgi:hypothetical protein